MLRPLTRQDVPAVVDLAVAAGMFTRQDVNFLQEALLANDEAICQIDVADDGASLASVVLYQPEEAADRVYDLRCSRSDLTLKGQGRGRALIRHVEKDLRDRGQRMPVVRTSGTTFHESTRRFDRRLGYAEHTRVADYWVGGDDLIMFTVHL